MRPDLPPHLTAEERFAEFCAARKIDETDEAWELFESWLDGDR
jgi:hypothetical protein